MTTTFDVRNFEEFHIGLASAETIRSWSKGEVKKPETINYRTLKPEKDGLFCEKIFGPTKDWECACGKYKRIRFKGIVCERCGVEVTRSKVRRERMGHIELAAPVSHIWYFKGSPSRLGYLLDISPKQLEKVLYFASNIITWVDEEAREEDTQDLKDEMLASLEELDAQRDRLIEGVRHQSTEYFNEQGEREYDEEDLLTPEEVESEIADLYEEFEDRKVLRQEALDRFLTLKERDLVGDEALYREMRANYRDYFRGGMGAEAVRDLLDAIDLEKEAEELDEIIKNGKGQKRIKAVKRLRVVEAFLHSNNNPSDMILDVIPVLPPELRPMVQLDGGRFATSDLNDLYRRVINRNNRLKKLLDLSAPEIIVNNEKRMLQEAVDALFDNGRRGRPVAGSGGRPLKSLADMLKGKQGRFRQNLLGKRVDYSGRSVIVVGPQLKIHQCGLPKQMALELFKPFVMKRLVELEKANNVKAARRMVERGTSIVWDILEEVIRDHPVLLNRAPTLHRLGIQAFEPVLVEGKAIRLHPLVCTAFNADFDGDQMAVHVPLGSEAQAEARVLMLSSNNIKSPAHGKPLTVPSQDMIIGIYYVTSARDGFPGEGRVFMDFKDAQNAYDCRADVDLQAKIKVRLKYDTKVQLAYDNVEEHKAGEIIETTIGRIIFNSVLPATHNYINHAMAKKEISRLVEEAANTYPTPEMMQILDGLKSVGYHYATRAGLTVSIWDATIPEEKAEILAAADKKVDALEEKYEMGYVTPEDRHRQVVDIWTATNEDVASAMQKSFDPFNPIYMMSSSGARGNMKQISQLAGMRGLMADPKGEIIDRPIKANFREGLSVLEYFTSTHGSRKGLTDTALRTADSGYLTRRLVDVAQDVIIHELDCGTSDGLILPVLKEKNEENEAGEKLTEPNMNLVGRCLAEDIVNPKTGELLYEAGEYVRDTEMLQNLVDNEVESIKIRSLMTCHAHKGVCQKCYGYDLSAGRPVNLGTAVGIIAAQSIGEPGTQLTMKTFHSGGVAGADITHGLPRVTELFEARRPKGLAFLSELDGTLQVKTNKDSKTLTITNDNGEVIEYEVYLQTQLMDGIKDMCHVKVGQQLTKGSIDPHELLSLTDVATTLRYIVEQVQGVYQSQGVDINDKHVEVIARQMLRKVTVVDAGDSKYLPGMQVNNYEFADEAQRIMLEGGEVPVARPLILGITKASLATDSFLSAASFQETTKVLTDAAIEGKVDHLVGLKENVIIGKPIPAGTGLKRYRDLQLIYKGKKVTYETNVSDELPDWASPELYENEKKLPKPEDLQHDGRDIYGNFINGLHGNSLLSAQLRSMVTPEQAKLYIFDDLGVSQRWANKFSEAGIETVGDLVGKTEDQLLRIEGIGNKAIEELRAGLEAKDLSDIILDEKPEELDAVQLLDSLYPSELEYIGGDVPRSYSADPDDLIGAPLNSSGLTEASKYEELIGNPLFEHSFGITSESIEGASNAAQAAGKDDPAAAQLAGLHSHLVDDLIGGPDYGKEELIGMPKTSTDEELIGVPEKPSPTDEELIGVPKAPSIAEDDFIGGPSTTPDSTSSDDLIDKSDD